MARLVSLSFLMLFVELALIRWIGSNVMYLSFFTNFVLLGSFLGIGIGFLKSESKVDLFPHAPVALAFLVGFMRVFPVTVECASRQIIYFGCTPSGLPIWITLPVVFAAVALTMATIAQGVARAFAVFDPLEAYRLDILGSLAGIATFTLLSFLGAPPLVWGSIAALGFFALLRPSFSVLQGVATFALLFVLGNESFARGESWSPYYKVSVFPISAHASEINVNGIPHQLIMPIEERRVTEPLYFVPYRRIRANPLARVLIVGAGNGSDAAIALASGARHVDGVEIDPRIYELGREMNPNHPYDDPRVRVTVDDGRAFLQRSTQTYDLILFALPDSLALVSGQSSLRLESYLFTLEAMRSARAHLAPGGAFAMYNYYREDWLIDRLAHTLDVAYGHPPCLDATVGSAGRFSLLTIGLATANVRCAQTWSPGGRSVPDPATDDHPFLYLRTPSIPTLYLIAVTGILVASLALVRGAGPLRPMVAYLDLVFMGVAFLLLETKNVVQFSLLFGTTWLVNALVFFGVLASVYVAIEVSRRVRIERSPPLYAALFAALAVAYVVDPQALLGLPALPRFAIATGVSFAPVFLANLIFARRFRAVGSSTVAFGANLLGAMLGGTLEYASLVVGYRALLPLVAVLYGCAFVLEAARSRHATHASAAAPV